MRRRATALLAALALTAGVAVGCGEDEKSSGSADSGAQGRTSEAPQGAPARIEDFQACLEKQGVELPEPGSGGAPPGDGMSEKMREAFEACQDELPEGVAPGNAPDTQPQ
jgi:hypothetical protein